MQSPSQSALESLETRSRDIVNLAQQYDADSQVTLSVKRRFFLVELDVAGLSPDTLTVDQINAIRTQGYPYLTQLLTAVQQINQYSSSPERLQWNPDAQPGRVNVPICMDWFIASIVPEELNHLDFLSRCERIWADSDPNGEGMLFTRIFNDRVKFVTGYEDGMRLVLCRVEVGEKSHPPVLPPPPQWRVEAWDLTRRMGAYDGCLGDVDWERSIQVPMGISRWNFTLAEIDRQDFGQLKAELGEKNFQTIVSTQGYVHPEDESSCYRGDDELPLYYYFRDTDSPNVRELILVGFGEMQPQRWNANIEGIWQVTEEQAAEQHQPPVPPVPLPPEPGADASLDPMPAAQTSPVRSFTKDQKTVLKFALIIVGMIVAIRLLIWLGGLLIVGTIVWVIYELLSEKSN